MNFGDMNKSKKILRDLVHGYINLTDIDLFIIDTPHFQRLKDIHQLTAQHVYPAARHTRFEHSLGVMELTRQAIKNINTNRFLSGIPKEMEEIYNENGKKIVSAEMEFNTSLAALLHDVGHCPFSHLGEKLFEEGNLSEDSVASKLQTNLIELIDEKKIKGLYIDDLKKSLKKEKCGSIHELISCIIILSVYYTGIRKYLSNLNCKYNEEQSLENAADFEYIIRCILGIPYKKNHKPNLLIQNIMIGLIKSDTLDMDKLDYIMRDAFYTGIAVPNIDTKRLFLNMHISKQYELVYTSNAVPVLQTIIESRDNLYLYVYNHHTVVYTDFLYYYIFRRLHRNADRYKQIKDDRRCNGQCHHFEAGVMRRESLFSIEAITKQMVSDCSLWHCLMHLHQELSGKYIDDGKNPDISCGNADECYNENIRVFTLLKHLFRRELPKPWWKTVFEYKNFMEGRIRDDRIRKELAKRICVKTKKDEGDEGIEAAEFRSQIAKGVIALSKKFENEKYLEKSLNDGDFFVVERSNRFFSLKSIENIYVYLKKNAIINHDLHTGEDERWENEYFAKSLTNLLPHKDYADFFDKDNFYIYIRPLMKKDETKERDFYERIEKIFVAVSSRLALMSESDFKEYCDKVDQVKNSANLPEMLEDLKKELEAQFQKLKKDNIPETPQEENHGRKKRN